MKNVASWTVPLDHAVFDGHFPGTPIFPGVMLLDAAMHIIADNTGIVLDTCEIRSVKFLSPARPGDVLVIQHDRTSTGTLRFEIVAGTRKIAIGEIVPGVPALSI